MNKNIFDIIIFILYIIIQTYIIYDLVSKEMYFYLIIILICIFANIYIAYMKYITKKRMKDLINKIKTNYERHC